MTDQSTKGSVLVVGGGVFGATSALELQSRGFEVTIIDPGPLPHPLAASTDISKAIRMDYGSDTLYMHLMEEAREGWHRWNQTWGMNLYHEDGVMFLSRTPMAPGGFEFESYQLLLAGGHNPLRVTDFEFNEKYPAWNAAAYPDGYFNPKGGWAESGNVVAAILSMAQRAGVRLMVGAVDKFLEDGTKITGVVTKVGDRLRADWVILAVGTWTPFLLPEVKHVMWSVAQPVFHFKIDEPALFQAPQFSTWGADISNTGWYGFPALDDGTLKVANHGPGWRLDPLGPREVPDGVEERFRDFLGLTFPGVENAPVVGTRMCFYCDTWDGNFWIDRHPDRPGLLVATGGSGHGFKFAPKIGEIVADIIEDRPNPYRERFAWRERGKILTEDARYS